MIATPATDPSAAAPAPPMMTPAPAAMNGAARPPVRPVKHNSINSSTRHYHHQCAFITRAWLVQIT